LKDKAHGLETLFIFGINRDALQTVIGQLDQEKHREAVHEIALEVNENILHLPLLVPVYREARHTILEERGPRKFEIAQEELDRLGDYVKYLNDPRLIVCHHNAQPADVVRLLRCLESRERYFKTENGRRYGRVDILISRLLGYFKVILKEVEGLKLLEDEIKHFERIKVFLKDISELEEKIRKVRNYKDPKEEQDSLIRDLQAGRITTDEFKKRYDDLSKRRKEEVFEQNGYTLLIRHVAHHYYVPILLSGSERIDWIRHVIRHPSEVRFLNALERYVEQQENGFASLDWWAFSRIDEELDEVYIPYYDVFWLVKDTDYAIVFVDPKGMGHIDWEYKVGGFRRLFRDSKDQPRVFTYGSFRVQVHLLLYTEDANQAPSHRDYWFGTPAAIPQTLRLE